MIRLLQENILVKVMEVNRTHSSPDYAYTMKFEEVVNWHSKTYRVKT